MKRNLLIAFVTLVAFQSNAQTTVFASGEANYQCFRIPAIIKADKTVFAFAEGRRNSCSDFGDVDIVYKTSTDGGKSWSELNVAVDNGNLQAGNPAPVFDTTDPRFPQGRLFLFYNTGTHSENDIVHGKGVREVWFITSTDGGQTWSLPENITLQVHRPNAPEVNPAYAFTEDWRHYANTPGHGIQLQNGRLYVPANISIGEPQNGKIPYRANAFYSDDHGQTFQLAETLSLIGSNEATAVQLRSGEVLLNARDQTEKTGKRYVARSSDNGRTWDFQGIDSFLTDPVCEGSLNVIQQGKREIVVLSHVFHPTKRQNLSLQLSKDGGQTWYKTLTVDAGSAAYSDVVVLAKRQVGVFYEKDDYQRIVFKRVKIR